MTEISIAYCSSHAPMMAAARDSAEEQQRNRFFGALEIIRDDARRAGVQACVVLSNEHFTNFFLENFPQICVGVGERNWGPTEAWLPISKAWIPGHPGLAQHITRSLLNVGLDRVALVGAGGLSHFIGVPRVGDIDEEFDRWFLDVLERGDIDAVLDLPDSELELAGNGAHEIRSWLAVAGACAPIRSQTMAYEPIYPWITGMGVSRFLPVS